MPELVFHAEEHSGHIRAHDPVETVERFVGEQLEVARKYRVVDRPVEPTEMLDRKCDHALDLFLDSHIRRNERNLRSIGARGDSLDRSIAGILVTARDDDGCAMRDETSRHPVADTLGTAGNDDDFPAEFV